MYPDFHLHYYKGYFSKDHEKKSISHILGEYYAWA